MGCSGPFPVPPALAPAFKALGQRKAEGDQPQPGAAPLLPGWGRRGSAVADFCLSDRTQGWPRVTFGSARLRGRAGARWASLVGRGAGMPQRGGVPAQACFPSRGRCRPRARPSAGLPGLAAVGAEASAFSSASRPACRAPRRSEDTPGSRAALPPGSEASQAQGVCVERPRGVR